jgi:hypothetical protein
VNNFDEGAEPYGVLFVKEINDVYQLNTKLTGEEILKPKLTETT